MDTNLECACRSVENELGETDSNDQELDSSSTENHSRADSSSRSPVVAHPAEVDANKNASSARSTCSSGSNDNSGSLASSHNPTACSAIRRNGSRNDHVDDVCTAGNSVRRGGAVNELMSLQDEIDESTHRGARFGAVESVTKLVNRRSLSRHRSSEKRDEGDSDDGSCPNENQGSEITHEFSDSATESEIAAHDPRTPSNKVK